MLREINPDDDHMMQFFTFLHLPPKLQEISAPICALAKLVWTTCPANPERSIALRKMLEAKDAAVRSVLAKGLGDAP